MNAQGPSLVAASLTAEAAFAVDPATAGRQQLLAVGATSTGHAVAWLTQDTWGHAAVQLRRHDDQGRVQGSDVLVGVDMLDGPPAAAVLPGGALVVASAIAGPLSVDQPWITRSAIRVQRLDADGRSTADLDIGVVQQNRIGATGMRYVADPAVIRWDHGGFLVGWALVQEDAGGLLPQFWVQRFDAGGQPVGSPSLATHGEVGGDFRLTASPEGGWLLTTVHRAMGRTFLRHHPFEGASAPVLPAGALGHAEGSLLMPLQGGGSVLLAPAKGHGSWQLYGADGRARGGGGTLPAEPQAAAALPDGGFVAFTGSPTQLLAERFDASGQPVGGPVAVAARANLQAAPLAGGGLLLGWTAVRENGLGEAMLQRLR